MRRINLLKTSLVALSLGLSVISCGSDGNTDIFETDPADDDLETVATIRLTEGGAADDIFLAEANGEAGSTVKGRVIFNSERLMKRLYITETMPGGSPQPFVIPGLDKKATKGDGSIDLDKDRADDTDNRKSFDFSFDLQVPENMNGEIVYNFWTTTGLINAKGDFRDPQKRQLVGVGAIVVKVGNGVNPSSKLLSYSGVKLFAPDSEGKTKAFFSLLDGEAYAPVIIADGQTTVQGPELRNLWDFGYYYTNNAAFSSTSEYTNNFTFNVEGFTPTAEENEDGEEVLYDAFFSLSTNFNSTDFDNVSVSGDLNSIVKSSESNITNLQIGDVIEFVDNYDNKGLIRVNNIKPGFNNNDFIEIDVKVQPSKPIMNN